MTENGHIGEIDVLRGLAVLGILAVNIGAIAGPHVLTANPLALGPASAAAQGVWLVVAILFSGKFVTIFSALFGASMLLVGGEGHDRDRNRVLRRRLLWLALFGAVHGAAIWWGDILLLYAACGAAAWFARGWPVRRLLIAGLGLMALTFGIEAAFVLTEGPMQTFTPAQAQKALAAYRGDLVEVQVRSFREWTMATFFSLAIYSWMTLGLMLVGMALLKVGALQGRRSDRFYRVCVTVGALALTAIAVPHLLLAAGGFKSHLLDGAAWLTNTALAGLAALGYLGLMVLACRRGGAATRALGQVGRMAFTNYIAQSLIVTGLFWGGRGLGLYGRLDPAGLALIVLAIWALQLAWSSWWLARFRYGPLEWVWRRLSYGGPTPFRR